MAELGQSGADLYYAPTEQEMLEAESKFPDLVDDTYPAECIETRDFVGQGGQHSVMGEWKYVIPGGATDTGQSVTLMVNTLLPLPGVEKSKCFQYLNTLRAMGIPVTSPIMTALQQGRGRRVALRVQSRTSKPYIDRNGEERPGTTRSEITGVLPLPADLPRLLRLRAAAAPAPAHPPVVAATTVMAPVATPPSANNAIQAQSPANWGL